MSHKFIGGWLPYGPYERDKSDPFGWRKPLTPFERITAIENECSGCWGQSGINSWERERLEEWKKLEHLSDKQEKILRQIESKAFGNDD